MHINNARIVIKVCQFALENNVRKRIIQPIPWKHSLKLRSIPSEKLFATALELDRILQDHHRHPKTVHPKRD